MISYDLELTFFSNLLYWSAYSLLMLMRSYFHFHPGRTSPKVAFIIDVDGHIACDIFHTDTTPKRWEYLPCLSWNKINEQRFLVLIIEEFITHHNWYINIFLLTRWGMQASWGEEYFAPEIAFKYFFRQQMFYFVKVHFLQSGNVYNS